MPLIFRRPVAYLAGMACFFPMLAQACDGCGGAVNSGRENLGFRASPDPYKPGDGVNPDLRIRATPQLPANARHAQPGVGQNAAAVSTSPGVVVLAYKQFSVYGYVQLSAYPDVYAVQTTPRYAASLGIRYSF